MSTLHQGLMTFMSRVNSHDQMRKVLKKWNKVILIDPIDSDATFRIRVNDSYVVNVDPLSREEASSEDCLLTSDVRLEAENSIMLQVFCENLSPAKANTDGLLEVYSSEKDRIKLDTISLILWGY